MFKTSNKYLNYLWIKDKYLLYLYMNTLLETCLISANRLLDRLLFVFINKKQIKKVGIFIFIFLSPFGLTAQRGYYTKGDTVFYSHYRMNNVDAKSFNIINSNYGTDGQKVYFKNKQIEGVDIASFRALNDFYSCDTHHVFYKEDIVEGANVTTFKIMDTDYASDKSNIYFWGEKLEGCDLKNFRRMEIDEEHYSCDHKRVYWRHRELKGIDKKTFRIMKGHSNIAFDKKRVYYYGRLIKGADSKTFEALSTYFYRDKRRVYTLLMDVVEGADAKTFRVYCPSSPYGGDKNRVFYKKEPLCCVDPDEFVVISYNMGHDGYFLYFEGSMMEPVSSHYLKMKPCGFE
nr:DKNYY domain-containing protein [Dysgonomonas sp. Marseille-P4361]